MRKPVEVRYVEAASKAVKALRGAVQSMERFLAAELAAGKSPTRFPASGDSRENLIRFMKEEANFRETKLRAEL